MKLEFTCIEERASDSGQRGKLIIPIPPPLPVVDGFGNHVAHPPPLGGALSLFITSPERQSAYYKIDALERKAKAIRPEHAADPEHKKELAAERALLEKQIAGLRGSLADLKELRLEHGAVYEVTIAKKGGGK